MWFQSWFSLTILGLMGAFYLPHPSSIDWLAFLLFSGISAYLGDLVFLKALNRMDVSITNLAWALLAIFLSAVGILIFREQWTSYQSIGAILIVTALLLIPLSNTSQITKNEMILLPLLALLYTPFFVTQKYALMSGETFFGIFFWQMLGREFCSFIFPWTGKKMRNSLITSLNCLNFSYVLTIALTMVFLFAGDLLTQASYQIGQLSLVSIVSNIQPFIVLVFAWMFVRFIPQYSPREVVTWQALGTKTAAFSLAFTGLLFIAYTT